jgi:hypothetical protein
MLNPEKIAPSERERARIRDFRFFTFLYLKK